MATKPPYEQAIRQLFGIRTSKYRVIIDCDGDRTTAQLLVNGEEVKRTTAKRNPKDKFNLRTGMSTAFERLWQKKPKAEKPPVTGGVFKVGDRVATVFPSTYPCPVGMPGTVVDVKGGWVGVRFDGYVAGHSLAGKCERGHGLWMYAAHLRHLGKEVSKP